MISACLALAPLLVDMRTLVQYDGGGPSLVVVGFIAIVVVGVGVVALIATAVWFLAKMRDRRRER